MPIKISTSRRFCSASLSSHRACFAVNSWLMWPPSFPLRMCFTGRSSSENSPSYTHLALTGGWFCIPPAVTSGTTSAGGKQTVSASRLQDRFIHQIFVTLQLQINVSYILGHINNLYNTVFWTLIQKGGLTTTQAEDRLKVRAKQRRWVTFSV